MDVLSQVLVVIALVAGGISTLQLNKVSTLRSDRDDWMRRDERHVKDIAEQATEMANLKAEHAREQAVNTAEIVTLKNEVAALQRAMRGDDHFDILGRKVDQTNTEITELTAVFKEHNDGAIEHWSSEIDLLTKVNEALGAMARLGNSISDEREGKQ